MRQVHLSCPSHNARSGRRALGAALLLCAVAASCATERRRVERGREEVARAFQSISYHRSGGLAGTSDHIIISETGTVQVSGRMFGDGNMLLSEFQMMQLARLFDGWERLKDEYPARPGSGDHFVTEIRYGTKTVVASDASLDVPDQFLRAKNRLEAMAREMPAR